MCNIYQLDSLYTLRALILWDVHVLNKGDSILPEMLIVGEYGIDEVLVGSMLVTVEIRGLVAVENREFWLFVLWFLSFLQPTYKPTDTGSTDQL